MEELFAAVARLQTGPVSGQLVSEGTALVLCTHQDPVAGRARTEVKLVSAEEVVSCVGEYGHPWAWSQSRRSRLEVRVKEERRTLEVYRDGRLVQGLEVTSKHGEVVTAPVLGRPTWSINEAYVAYIAEGTKSKTASFWDSEAKEGKGLEYVYRETLGDGLEGISKPTLWVYDIQANKITEIDSPNGTFPTQPNFAPSGEELVFVAYAKEAYLQGIASNMNRSTSLCRLILPATLIQIPIPSRFMSAFHQIYSPNGEFLAYFAVPHTTSYCTSVVLCLYSLADNSHRILIDLVPERRGTFNGIYGYHSVLEKLRWVNESILAFESHFEGGSSVFIADLNGEVREIELPVARPYHTELLDVSFARVLVKVSNLTIFPQLYIVSAASTLQYTLSPLCNFSPSPHSPSDSLILSTLSAAQHSSIDHNGVTSHLYYTKRDLPLCVVLHGGPHNTGWAFMHAERTMLLCAGFNVLMANYRGTSGFGLNLLNALTGHIGEMDVGDVLEAIEIAKREIGAKSVFVTGVSHGGFLSAHLACTGQVQGAVVKNGVNNILDMVYASDTPDWSAGTALGTATSHPLTEEEVVAMYNASPIARAGAIKCPVLIVAAGNDACVPPFSSINLYKVLKKTGVDVTMLWYPQDGHILATPSTQHDHIMNEILWLLRLVKS